jgi:long-chain acyl-CoA synthetase
MENNLKELNKLLASYEQVASITVYPTEFEKTPKRSIKRYLYNTALLEK